MAEEDQEMSDAEAENLQSIVHQIARHIVEGSAAIQELRAAVARLQVRHNLEAIVAENWLTAATIIQRAGKDVSSWDSFRSAIDITYGRDNNHLHMKDHQQTPGNDNVVLEYWSKELRAGQTTSKKKRKKHDITTPPRTADDHNSLLRSETELLSAKASMHEHARPFYTTDEFQRLVQCGVVVDSKEMEMGDEMSKVDLQPCSRRKKKKEEIKVVVQSGKNVVEKRASTKVVKAARIRFLDGREIDRETMSALKKEGRCFFCEKKGHLASSCADNPANK